MRRYCPEFYDLLAARRGGFWRGDHGDRGVCRAMEHKTSWECGELHGLWDAEPDSIQQGSWCPTCAGLKPLTLEDCRALAAEHKNTETGACGLFLSKDCLNGDTKAEWQCEISEEHRWWATPSNVKHRRSWCPYCAGHKPDSTNSLAVLRPDLAAEWDPQNTISPEEITVSSNKKVGWICKENLTHILV